MLTIKNITQKTPCGWAPFFLAPEFLPTLSDRGKKRSTKREGQIKYDKIPVQLEDPEVAHPFEHRLGEGGE